MKASFVDCALAGPAPFYCNPVCGINEGRPNRESLHLLIASQMRQVQIGILQSPQPLVQSRE